MAQKGKPTPEIFLLSVGVCVLAGIIMAFILFPFMKGIYSTTSWQESHFLFFDTSQNVTWYTYTWMHIIGFVIIPAAFYGIFIHPCIGRFIAAFINFLADVCDKMWKKNGLVGNWDADGYVLVASFWPVTIVVVPFLLVGIVLGYIYNSLWEDSM